MNRIDRLFQEKNRNILSVYFTAGYPELDSTIGIIRDLAAANADMIEIGMPFSDPLADGPVIQRSCETALRNGMSLSLLFKQLQDIRSEINIPILLMGYLNPVLKFGMEEFCSACSRTGIDGVILPDLPPEIYLERYKSLFEKHDLFNILLITPQSDEPRIRIVDSISRGFIYMVSSSSTTGIKSVLSAGQQAYFERVQAMKLRNPKLIGFGISDTASFRGACNMAEGAIIGSAFIKMLANIGTGSGDISAFIRELRS